MNKLQRLNRHNARQFFIGVIMAMPLIFILSLALPNFKTPSVLKFDSENIEVVSSHASPNESETTHEDTHTDVPQKTPTHDNERIKKSAQFSHFAKNMKSLSEAQKKAISGNAPRLSIIIPDIGLNRQILAKIMEVIPPSVTLALSPYSQNHNEVTKQLNGYGFETWMNMASLTLSTDIDPGALALNPTHNFERNIGALSEQLKNKNNITGLVLPSQSLITETPKLWEDMVMDIYGQGFGIIDNTSTLLQPRLFFYNDLRAPYIKGDSVINTNTDKETLQNYLKNIETKILEQNNFIMTYPISTPASLDILSRWIDSLDDKNITVLPLSAQAKL